MQTVVLMWINSYWHHPTKYHFSGVYNAQIYNALHPDLQRQQLQFYRFIYFHRREEIVIVEYQQNKRDHLNLE